MGCFSFKCLECGLGIKSTSFTGERVNLYLLKNGAVIQKMSGAYNSYGGVFINGTQRPDVNHKLRLSKHWTNPFPEKPLDDRETRMSNAGDEHWIWSRVCDLMHDKKDISNGIAAIHAKCEKGIIPTIRSVSDPDQGWGSTREKPIPGYDPHKDHRIDSLRKEIWNLKHDVDFKKSFLDEKKPYYDMSLKMYNEIKEKLLLKQEELKSLGIDE